MFRLIAIVGAALVLLLSACGSDPEPPAAAEPSTSSDPAPTPTPTPEPAPTPPARGTVIITAGSDFGTMLFDRTRQAIYLFDKETTARAECYGECADDWPPVLTQGAPRARGDVKAGLLGTTKRKDGSLQVTYGGHPLYFYAHEGKDEVLCHDVEEYGGTWLVVTPTGDPAPA